MTCGEPWGNSEVAKMRTCITRVLLASLLIGLLGYAWLAEQRSPAYPDGPAPSLVLFAGIAVTMTTLVVAIARLIQARHRDRDGDASER